MPFTLAHPAAVLPLRRTGLPMAGLVLGSMVPDVPLFTHRLVRYDLTHSWLGVVTVDPLLALAATALWYAVARDALVDLAPAAVRDRLPAHVRLSARQWALVPVAAVLGAVTHVTWDAFTHVGRWGVGLVPALGRGYGPLPGYAWAQYASGVVGLGILVVVTMRHLVGQPVRPRPRRTTGAGGRLVSGVATVLLVVAAVVGARAALAAPAGWHQVAYAGTITALTALGAGAAVVCLLWRVLADRPA